MKITEHFAQYDRYNKKIKRQIIKYKCKKKQTESATRGQTSSMSKSSM